MCLSVGPRENPPNEIVVQEILAQGIEAYNQGNIKAAFAEFNKAIKFHSSPEKCLFDLGNKFIDGDEVKQDIPLGMKYLAASMSLGHIPAAINLGLRYFKGDGVGQDIAQAKRCFEKFAETDRKCRYHLGVAIVESKTCEADEKNGYELIIKAAKDGYQRAKEVIETPWVKRRLQYLLLTQ